jgi:hypothetical protein
MTVCDFSKVVGLVELETKRRAGRLKRGDRREQRRTRR